MSRCCCSFTDRSNPPSPAVIGNNLPLVEISLSPIKAGDLSPEITTELARGNSYRISSPRKEQISEEEEKVAVIQTAGILGKPKILKAIVKEFPQINIFSDTDYDGRTALMYASHVGNLPVIKWLLKGGADINAIDKRHKTALHYALQLQDDKIVKFLLTKGANFLAKDNSGQISLHYAVSNKTSTEALRLLLKLINDPYTCHLDNCGHSALHMAIIDDNTKAIRFLLETESSLALDQLDEENRNPFMLACLCGFLECVQLLLPKLSTNNMTQRDTYGCDSFHLAIASRNDQLVEFLIDQGQININSVDNELRTPLHYATMFGMVDTVKLLSENGALLLQDRNGLSAIHIAAVRADTGCLDCLLNHFKVDPVDTASRSAFMWSVVVGNLSDIQLFLSSLEIDKNHTDIDGINALHLACMGGNTEIVSHLIKLGWSTYNSDKKGKSPLIHSAEFGHESVAQLLMSSGCDLASRDQNGRTALHWAALGGHLNFIQLLLKRGLQANLTDSGGRTALHCAAYVGSSLCCRALLQYGCVVDEQDNEGFTALHWASRSGKLDVIKLLLDYDTPVNCLSLGDNRLTSMDLAVAESQTEVEKYLRESGGFTYAELREIAAVAIQSWFRSLKVKRNKKSKPK